METLDNYILERLNPRHLGHSEFPVTGTADEVIEFLKDRGFKYSENIPVYPLDFIPICDSRHDKFVIYTLEDDDNWPSIIFGNTSRKNISVTNPLYQIIYNGNNISWMRCDNEMVYMRIQEFKKEMNKYFK